MNVTEMNPTVRYLSGDDRPLLVLDIDEALLHAARRPLSTACDYRAERTWIYKRPYVDAFLAWCAKYFQLAIWASARHSFAEEIFTRVFAGLPLKFIHSQRHCLCPTGIDRSATVSIKPLARLSLRGYSLARIVMIDDSPEKHCLNPDNLIPIKPFFGAADDNELALLKTYLNHIKDIEDFRRINKLHWRQSSIIQAQVGYYVFGDHPQL